MKSFLFSCFLLVFLLMAPGVGAQKFEEDPAGWAELKQHKAAPDWFADAKLGIYFHWGVYSVPGWGSEWYPRWMYVPDRVGWGSEIYGYHRKTYGADFQYHDFIPLWKAPQFDAAEWVSLFEDAGAKIIGSIAEHHDGFSLWHSRVNPWNAYDKGPGIDVVKAIHDEAHKRGLKFMATFHHGFNMRFYPKPENSYLRPVSKYSIVQDSCRVPQAEKYRLLYGNMDYDEANDFWLAKLNEVVDGYCPDYIWMDFGQRFIKKEYLRQFLTHYFNTAASLNKEVVVNTKGSYFPTELAIVNVERATMENITPDVWVTDFILGSAWSYNQAKRTALDPIKAIRMLAEVVSKNGVMLLSAGPMADGTIPEEQVATLKKMGAWLKLYGESIYETRPFITFGEGPTVLKRNAEDAWNEYGAIKQGLNNLNALDVRYTRKGNVVYAIQLGWNQKENQRTLKAFVPGSAGLKVSSVSVLGSDERIRWRQSNKGLTVSQPANKPKEAEAALVYKIVLR